MLFGCFIHTWYIHMRKFIHKPLCKYMRYYVNLRIPYTNIYINTRWKRKEYPSGHRWWDSRGIHVEIWWKLANTWTHQISTCFQCEFFRRVYHVPDAPDVHVVSMWFFSMTSPHDKMHQISMCFPCESYDDLMHIF